jgi:hypothetical protein
MVNLICHISYYQIYDPYLFNKKNPLIKKIIFGARDSFLREMNKHMTYVLIHKIKELYNCGKIDIIDKEDWIRYAIEGKITGDMIDNLFDILPICYQQIIFQ